MPSPDRSRFLNDFWRAYPQAPERAPASRWQGAREFSDAILERRCEELEWVCGRLTQLDGNSGTLEGDGLSVSIAFLPATLWSKDAVLEPCDFNPSQLAIGDLVALRVHSATAETNGVTRYQVKELCLLVATENRASSRCGAAEVDPSAAGFAVSVAHSWMRFTATVREHFVAQGFVEALTPTLVPSPGTEPHLDPFVTHWDYGHASRDFYLPTSPEFHLKRLLVRGCSRVFEFKTCFRNGEVSEHHQPEFQMLEWYRAFNNLDAIAKDVQELFEKLSSEFELQIPTLKRTTIRQLFQNEFGFALTPQTSREELIGLAGRESIRVASDDSWDDIYFRLFLERIEGDLGKDGPLLVRGYPPSQAALSRIGSDGFADRFEVYWKGMELANAFHELNDPAENEARFRQDAELKKQLGKSAVPVDEALIRDLYFGMPPAGGIALGLDRLFMAVAGIDKIAMARAFAIKV